MTPGAVVVWTDARPCVVAHRIPADGLTIGEHARIALAPKGIGGLGEILEIWPVGDARIELDGRPLTAHKALVRSTLPAFVAAGKTVLVLVEDVEAYENLAITRQGNVVIGSAFGPVVKQIDDAANAEEHLSLKGPSEIVRALAQRYGDKLGNHAWFRPGGDQHLDHFLSTRGPVRTVILELSRVLFEHDVRAIAMLLETDLRFVIVRSDDHYLQWLPPALAERTLEVPRYACDERVVVIADRAKDRRLRATTVAGLLDLAERLPEERWNLLFDRVLDSWNDASPPQLETILTHLR